jgi:hypothetical protein
MEHFTLFLEGLPLIREVTEFEFVRGSDVGAQFRL